MITFKFLRFPFVVFVLHTVIELVTDPKYYESGRERTNWIKELSNCIKELSISIRELSILIRELSNSFKDK